jgi:hypothetical protein
MPAFNKFQQFAEDLGQGVHDLVGTDHTLRVYLSNTAPDAAADAVKADLAEIATGNGYNGAEDTQNNGSESGGTLTVTGVDVTITASGNVAAFRYVVLYNDTPTSPADPLIGWWDYGSEVNLTSGQSFLIDFGASMFTIT